MNIKVIGTGCEKCDALYKNVQNAIKELDIDAEIEKVEDLIDIVKLGVMTSPSLMVDGKLVFLEGSLKWRNVSNSSDRHFHTIFKMVPGVSHQEPFYITISKYSIAALLFT